MACASLHSYINYNVLEEIMPLLPRSDIIF